MHTTYRESIQELIDGTIGGGGFRTTDGVVLPLPGAAPAAGSEPMVYGVRPEHLSLSDDGIPMIVQVVEPTGAELQVFAKVGEQSVTAVLRERIEPQPGDTIRLKPDLGQIHLFDRKSGRRV